MIFDIRSDKVRLQYRQNNIVFTPYNSSSQHAFNRFKKQIASPDQYNDIADVLSIAVKNEVRGVGGTITIHKNIAY